MGSWIRGRFRRRRTVPLYERLSPPARQVIARAQDEARGLGYDWLGTEHLLLGLLAAGGDAAAGLAPLQVTLAGARAQINSLDPIRAASARGRTPFTSRAKTVLELAAHGADHDPASVDPARAVDGAPPSGGAPVVGTGHLLRALVTDGGGLGGRLLARWRTDATLAGEAVSGELDEFGGSAVRDRRPGSFRADGGVGGWG